MSRKYNDENNSLFNYFCLFAFPYLVIGCCCCWNLVIDASGLFFNLLFVEYSKVDLGAICKERLGVIVKNFNLSPLMFY